MNDYIFYYSDGAYIIHRLTEDQFNTVAEDIAGGKIGAKFDGILLVFKDIRAIVKQEPLPEKEQSFSPDLSELEMQYLAEMRRATLLADEEADDDDEGASV